MLGCELLFTPRVGAEVRAEIESQTGQPCPCLQGNHCPLLPHDLGPLLRPPTTPALVVG